jgi:hypothetical protein
MAGDSTQFLIDLAAKFTGGQSSVATLAELGDKMLFAGAASTDFEKVVKATAAAVDESAAAFKTANEALAVGQTEYDQLESAAERASKSVEKINQLVADQAAKLAAAQKAGDEGGVERASAKMAVLAEKQADAGKKAEAAALSFKTAAAALDVLKAKAAGAEQMHTHLAKGLENVEAAAEKAKKAEADAAGSGSLKELSSGLAKIGGPAAAATDKVIGLAEGFKKLVSSLGSAGGYVAIAAGILAIASAAVVATIAITKWGVANADANRTTSLLAAGIAHTVAGGQELEATITKLGDVVPQSREELTAMASDLAKAGFRGKDLSNQLEIAAVKAAQLKWGPEFSKQLLSLDVQSRRLHDNLADTFGGLNIEKLLGGIQTLVALFDSTTESGRALKFLFEALFQPIVDGAGDATVKIERFFLYGEILALKAYIALKPYRSEIEALGKAFVIGSAIIIGLFAYAVFAVIASVGLLIAEIGALAVYLYDLGGAIVGGVSDAFHLLNQYILDLVDIGGQMIDGLINGITGGAKKVADSMVGVVTGGVSAVEKALGIGSPSKVLYDIGADTTAGFTGGVDDTSDDAQASLASMVAPPKGAPPGASSGGGNVINIAITIEGRGKSDDSILDELEDRLRDIFDVDSLTIGGGEVPATP